MHDVRLLLFDFNRIVFGNTCSHKIVPINIVVVALVVIVVVWLDVWLEDGVEDWVVEGVVVIEVVGDEEIVDVAVDETDVVGLDVGVVTVQFSNPPLACASVILFKLSTMSSQFPPSTANASRTHEIETISPAGPRNSVRAAPRISAAAVQLVPSVFTTPSVPSTVPHCKVPLNPKLQDCKVDVSMSN